MSTKTAVQAAKTIGIFVRLIDDQSDGSTLDMVAAAIVKACPDDAAWDVKDLIIAYETVASAMPDQLINAVVSLAAEQSAVDPFIVTINDAYLKTSTNKTTGKTRTNVVPAMLDFQGGEWKHSGRWVSVNVLRLAYKYAAKIKPLMDEADLNSADFRRKNQLKVG